MSRFEASRGASAYAMHADGFDIFWANSGDWYEHDKRGVLINNRAGWYVGVPTFEDAIFGPYETSQAAFDLILKAIDRMIVEA